MVRCRIRDAEATPEIREHPKVGEWEFIVVVGFGVGGMRIGVDKVRLNRGSRNAECCGQPPRSRVVTGSALEVVWGLVLPEVRAGAERVKLRRAIVGKMLPIVVVVNVDCGGEPMAGGGDGANERKVVDVEIRGPQNNGPAVGWSINLSVASIVWRSGGDRLHGDAVAGEVISESCRYIGN